MTDTYSYARPPRRMTHLEGRSILAIADGLTRLPIPPFTFDCHGLTDPEYLRVVAWRAKSRGWDVALMTEEVP